MPCNRCYMVIQLYYRVSTYQGASLSYRTRVLLLLLRHQPSTSAAKRRACGREAISTQSCQIDQRTRQARQ